MNNGWVLLKQRSLV